MIMGASREYLATEPLGHLMVRLALPAMVAQIANLLYSMIDRIFLGHLEGAGTDMLAGLGICMPIIAMVASFAMLGASGAAPMSSIELGRRNNERAQHIVENAQTLVLLMTIVLMAVCYLFMEPLLVLFGASEVTAPYAAQYLGVYLLGTVFVMIWEGMGLFLLAQGDAKQLLIATGVGAVAHIALAALCVFVLDWGAMGAAASSVISQAISAVIVLYYLRRPESALRFEFKLVPLDARLTLKSISVGSGRFFIVFSEGLLLMVVNTALQQHGGDVYVGAMTVLYSLQSIVASILIGFAQGTQPIVSYCYGAGKLARARTTTRHIVLISFAGTFVLTGLIMLFPEQSAQIFTSDSELVELTASYTRLFFIGMLFFGLQTGMQTIFMGLEKGLCSLTVAAVRKLVIFIPLVLYLSSTRGVDGVFLAEPISDLASVAFCTVLFLLVIPKMLRGEDRVS